MKCKTVYEFQCYHKNYTNKRKEDQIKHLDNGQDGKLQGIKKEEPEASGELQKKIFNLENDVRYYKRLYQELHFEMDRTAMSLMKARRENRLLKQKLEGYVQMPCEEKHSMQEGCVTEKILEGEENPETEEHLAEGEKPDEDEHLSGKEEIQEVQEPAEEEPEEETGPSVFWESWNPEEALLPDTEPAAEELRDAMAELTDTMAECVPEAEGHVPEVAEIQVDTKKTASRNEKKNPVLLFMEIVQKIRMKRFLKKKEADQRRELVNLMNRNGYGSERQKLVLTAMNQESMPIESIWNMVYQGFTAEQLREGLYAGLPESIPAT